MAYEMRIEDNTIIFQFKSNKLSSISLETLKGLDMALDKVNNEDDVKGLIMVGTDRFFSGGFDLNEFVSFKDGQEILNWFKIEEDVLYKLFTCNKPVIAAVNGNATAAGMIVAMAADWRIAINHPKIKIGMTEIKIGLSLTPAEACLMRWGLDSEKNYRDIIFKGELMSVNEIVNRGIFDQLVDDYDQLMEQAKAKVSALIDTPGRPFIGLKYIHRKNAASIMRQQIDEFEWEALQTTFTDEKIIATLTMVKNALGI
ncbi:MAG TPA: enoyl-CoA hydratase/isomerase family protein [Syntrophomonadaceae bacterium]|nr:enoyl-CoA hydratase/isomerase family protein [Syntrophomonadaceae bacterium]HNX29774.1 enoyl-CoA hydratase/isomerase family protein [Syntrophomonadaceae bacterium]HNX92125.1 enoyl-CoA hydratase/isomerase family protein [Syntrophomonas sp.]